MKFKTEYGAIVDVGGNIITLVPGTPGSVVFPQEIIHKLQMKSPGYIHKLVHTHPPDMRSLSHEDKTTLKAQALWFYPYPIRMSTITEDLVMEEFIETVYLGLLEPKEIWKARGGERGFEIIKEDDFPARDTLPYADILIEMSYE